MKRRLLLSSSSLLGLSSLPSLAQGRAPVFAINEPVSYATIDAESSARYATLLTDLNRKTGSAYRMDKVLNYADLEAGLKAGRYDLAFVHPAHIAMAALAAGQYRLVALSKAHVNYRAYFLTRGDSPIKSLAQLAGRTLITPDTHSATAWMARAALAETLPNGANGVNLRTVRFQEAIRLAVENKIVDAGVTASFDEVKEWQASGHAVLATSRAAPIKMLLAHKRLEPQLDSLRSWFESQAGLAKVGVPAGLVGFEEAVVLKIWEWLRRGAPQPA